MSAAAAGSAVRRARASLTPRAAVLAVVVMAILIYLVVPLRTYVTQRNRLTELEHQTQILEQQNAKLAHEVRMLKDPAQLERIARECLGMVKKGEIGFIVVPEGTKGRAPPADC